MSTKPILAAAVAALAFSFAAKAQTNVQIRTFQNVPPRTELLSKSVAKFRSPTQSNSTRWLSILL